MQISSEPQRQISKSTFTAEPCIGYLSKVTLAEVAQLVERGPEKAGVGGSTPSLGINLFKNLQTSFVYKGTPLGI